MLLTWILVTLIILSGAFISYRTQKLSLEGAAVGAFLAVFLYAGAGVPGLLMMAAFFISAVAATRWRMEDKEKLQMAERDKGRRNAWQVLSNAGAAVLFSVCLVYSGDTHIVLLIAACFSAATADTLSSELGTLYGKRFYNIINFKKDTRGRDGVISLEGTLMGMGGSVLIAVVHSLAYGWHTDFFIIVIAGTAGNVTDSILGATAERKGIIGNDLVNFTCTLTAAAVAECLYLLQFVFTD